MTLLVFFLLVFGPLCFDVFNRRDDTVSMGNAIKWSCVYIGSALLFAVYLAVTHGFDYASLFLSGYTLEKMLSIDNLMIFASIFAYFGIPANKQYRVLHIGIIGSVILRLLFVVIGVALFSLLGRFLEILFGIFVIISITRLNAEANGEPIDHNSRWYIRLTKTFLPVTGDTVESFFVRRKKGFFAAMPTATPLLLALIAVECTDIAFAFDSVPAVIAISKNRFIAYSSIMFAVVGLRSLFFVLESLKRYTAGMETAIRGVLMFVGIKMIVSGIFNVTLPAGLTLIAIAAGVTFGLLPRRSVRPV